MQVNHNSRIIFHGRASSSSTAATGAAVAGAASGAAPSSSSSNGVTGGSSTISSSSSRGVGAGPNSSSSSSVGSGGSSRTMSSSNSSSSSSRSQVSPFKGYIGCLRHMVQQEGGLIRPLFRGWLVNCCKTVPGAALQFVAYDLLKVGVTYLDPASGAMSPL